jgi:hypothetical protein
MLTGSNGLCCAVIFFLWSFASCMSLDERVGVR